MKRFLFLLLVPLFSFADAESDFNTLKAQIQNSLYYLDSNVTTVDQYLQNAVLSFSQLGTNLTGDFASGYNTALGDVSQVVMPKVRTAQTELSLLHNNISDTQRLVSQLTYSSGTNIDYRAILERMTNQLERIADLQDLTDDHVMTNTSVLSELFIESTGVLNAILTAIQDIEQGSSGGNGSDLSTIESDLVSIIDLLDMIEYYLNEIYNNLYEFIDFFTSQDGVFRTYLKLVEDRLKTPDVNLQTDLSRMWEYLLQNATNAIYNPSQYSLQSQTYHVLSHLGENDIRLSNEGVIQLENLAVNQRQYLCSVEALSYLKNMTNNSDIAWITNYLHETQSSFYEQFNIEKLTNPNVAQYPFNIRRWQINTNFFHSFTLHRGYRDNAYRDFRATYTNWFDRVELNLMALNGLFSDDTLSETDETNELLDQENVDRRMRYATNELQNAIQEVGTVSNNLLAVSEAFKSLVSAFDLDSINGVGSPVVLLPEYEMGGITISQIYFQANDYSDLKNFGRVAFTCIYYLVFSVILWFLFTFSFKVFVKCVSFVSSTVSKLLS